MGGFFALFLRKITTFLALLFSRKKAKIDKERL
jgi:hypothetical protein